MRMTPHPLISQRPPSFPSLSSTTLHFPLFFLSYLSHPLLPFTYLYSSLLPFTFLSSPLLPLTFLYSPLLHFTLHDSEAAADVPRSLELAAYFTHCNLQPAHLMLALKTAMALAFKNKVTIPSPACVVLCCVLHDVHSVLVGVFAVVLIWLSSSVLLWNGSISLPPIRSTIHLSYA